MILYLNRYARSVDYELMFSDQTIIVGNNTPQCVYGLIHINKLAGDSKIAYRYAIILYQ